MSPTVAVITRLAALGAALPVAGAAWQRRVEASLTLTPPGRMVAVDGRRAHVLDHGHGGPTVVLESGLGGCNLEWRSIHAALAARTRVVHVDRPGLGYSDPAPGPRSARQVAAWQWAALDAAEIPGPYVLVGHSLGGLYIRAMAHQRPQSIAGMVYLDPTHDAQAEIPALRRHLHVNAAAYRVIATLCEVGLLRLIASSFAALPEGVDAAEATRLYSRRTAVHTIAAEAAAVPASIADVVALDRTRPLPAIPAVVLSAGRYPKAAAGLFAQATHAAHQDLAGRHAPGRHHVIDDAGHLLHRERPDLVAAAVDDVIGRPDA